MMKLTLKVNGKDHAVEVEGRTLLVDVLRDTLALTGTHVGCDTSQCGCCTVHLDGKAVKSCNMLAMQAEGHAITTIEGLAASVNAGDELHPMQKAFSECHALQCGFCTPGMIMAASAFLAVKPKPTDEEICHALEGNLCRCTGYVNIVKAVKQAAGIKA
ncbi:MAG: (2Fe-2S)-binding protein [Burkholderiales bacterium]